MKTRSVALAFIFSTVFGISACNSGDSREEALKADREKAANEELERQANSKFLEGMTADQKSLEKRIEAARMRFTKQGNKTRKVLKPKLEAIELDQMKVGARIGHLSGLQGPEFMTDMQWVKIMQDSLSAEIAILEKNLK